MSRENGGMWKCENREMKEFEDVLITNVPMILDTKGKVVFGNE